MAFGGPAGNKVGKAAHGVGCASFCPEIDGFPVGVVKSGAGPEWGMGVGVERRVANGEFPGAVEADYTCADANTRSDRRGRSLAQDHGADTCERDKDDPAVDETRHARDLG